LLTLLAAIGVQRPVDAAELSADETRQFMRDLARYVEEHHLRRDDVPMKGMIYEYFVTDRAGQVDQWIQGEALDTMHDGAWYAAAMASAHRATGDAYYLDFLTKWQIPFYAKVLNHSDELFRDGLDPAKAADSLHKFDTQHRYMGEKGFCPYWWDDGASVSIEHQWRHKGQHPYECVDDYLLQRTPNLDFRLKGFSLGCSNHMAQDLAVMLIETWLVTRDKRLAEAAMHLQKSRAARKYSAIPMCVAAAGLTNGAAALLAQTRTWPEWEPDNDFARDLYDYQPDQKRYAPNFADDQEYVYYSTIAREGGRLPRNVAMRLIYDAVTRPMYYLYWSDDAEVPAGMNRSEQSPVEYINGKPWKYKSDWQLPAGSRFGPQNMVVSAWALQALHAYPGIWEERCRKFADDLPVRFLDKPPAIDGDAEDGYSKPLDLDGVEVRLAADRHNLYLAGRAPGAKAQLAVSSHPDGKGRRASIAVERSGQVDIQNARGEKLLHEAKVVAEGQGLRFEIRLPYTVVKGQKEWATGIEHGRYSIAGGKAPANFYLMSSEEQIVRRLRRELIEGLANWRDVFRKYGYLPNGFGRRLESHEAEKISETGGYAHAITAAAQYLILLDGKRDWELEEIPR
jgi:hypothetical protein